LIIATLSTLTRRPFVRVELLKGDTRPALKPPFKIERCPTPLEGLIALTRRGGMSWLERHRNRRCVDKRKR
jgi:hypothetical protein